VRWRSFSEPGLCALRFKPHGGDIAAFATLRPVGRRQQTAQRLQAADARRTTLAPDETSFWSEHWIGSAVLPRANRLGCSPTPWAQANCMNMCRDWGTGSASCQCRWPPHPVCRAGWLLASVRARPHARHRCVHTQPQAFARIVVDLDSMRKRRLHAKVSETVLSEVEKGACAQVERTALVRSIRPHHPRPGANGALATTVIPDPQVLLAT